MDPLSAAIGGIGAGLSSLLGGYFNTQQSQQEAAMQKYNVDMTNKANRDLAQMAFDRNRQMWMEANQYNSPAAQMVRLKAAGLNPHLVYGGNAVGNQSGSIPTYQAPRASYDYKAPVIPGQVPMALQSFLNFQMQQAQIDNTKAQTAAIKTRTVNDVIQGRILELVEYRQPEINSIYNTRAREAYNRYEKYSLPGFSYMLEGLKAETEGKQKAVDRQIQEIANLYLRNEWMRSGVTPSDNFFLRLLSREFKGDLTGGLDNFLQGAGKFYRRHK